MPKCKHTKDLEVQSPQSKRSSDGLKGFAGKATGA